MSNLSQRLAALMQDDSVPMSDAWGKLFDDLKQADCALGELLTLQEVGESSAGGTVDEGYWHSFRPSDLEHM